MLPSSDLTPDNSGIRRTVLVADDSPEDRAAFRRYLSQDRSIAYTFVEKGMGEDALSYLLGEDNPTPDCLLLDFNLPDMDGLELLAELARASGGGDQLPCAVVMLTGSGDESAAVAAMKAGVQDYLVKNSLAPDALRRAVDNAFEKFDLSQRLRDSEARLRMATEAAGIGTWTYDPRSGYVTSDPRYRTLLGLPDIAPMPQAMCIDRVHEDDRERVARTIQDAVERKNDGRYSVEYRTVIDDTKPDMARWVQSTGQAHYDRTRTHVERMVGTALDITERKTVEEERERHAARQEHIAETLQRSLLIFPPRSTFPRLDFYIEYIAALDEAFLGGDFADVFGLEGERVAFVVGDVTGKGLAAATYTAEIKFALRAFLRESSDPAQAMARLNRYLVGGQRLDSDPQGRFVSLAIAVHDLNSREVACSCAGAEPPLIVRRDATGTVTASPIEVNGPLLVMDESSRYVAATAQMESGDLLVITTDGITEARSRKVRQGEIFGYDRFSLAAEDAFVRPTLEEAARAIVLAASDYAGGNQSDDICLLVARCMA